MISTKDRGRASPPRAERERARGIVGHLVIRLAAVVCLTAVVLLGFGELGEMRGELAFARFHRLQRLAARPLSKGQLEITIENASAEADLVMLFSRRNPEALTSVSAACQTWVSRKELDHVLRLHLADKAVQTAALAVHAAPSDYYAWLRLASAQAGYGLWEGAQVSMARAQDLAPPGKRLRLSRTEP